MRAATRDTRAATRDVVEDAPLVSAADSRSRRTSQRRTGPAAAAPPRPQVRLVTETPTVGGLHTTSDSVPQCELLVEMGRGGRGSLD